MKLRHFNNQQWFYLGLHKPANKPYTYKKINVLLPKVLWYLSFHFRKTKYEKFTFWYFESFYLPNNCATMFDIKNLVSRTFFGMAAMPFPCNGILLVQGVCVFPMFNFYDRLVFLSPISNYFILLQCIHTTLITCTLN